MKILKNKKQQKQSGFNLMELLFSLVVIGGMVVGIVAMYNKNQATSNSKTVAQDIQTISSGVKTLYASSTSGFDTLNTATVVNAGIAPKTLVTNASTGKITNKYNGDVTITPGAAVDGYYPSFMITEAKLPTEVITKAVGQLGTEGILSIAVGADCIFSTGTTGADVTSSSCASAKSYDAATLASAAAKTDPILSVAFSQ